MLHGRTLTYAQAGAGELRLVHNVDRLEQAPQFRSNWVQRNAPELREFSSGLADLDRSGSAFSERRVTELSGGERSRDALARVFAVEAPVILADEPTSSLDPRHQIDVMKSLRSAADKGTLVIVVTHDLGLAARFADQMLVLSDGRLVSHGAAAEALSEQVMADVFRISAYRAEYQREAVIVPWAEI